MTQPSRRMPITDERIARLLAKHPLWRVREMLGVNREWLERKAESLRKCGNAGS